MNANEMMAMFLRRVFVNCGADLQDGWEGNSLQCKLDNLKNGTLDQYDAEQLFDKAIDALKESAVDDARKSISNRLGRGGWL